MNITKKDLNECQRCKTPFDQAIDLRGIMNRKNISSHFNSKCGWWLRIDHEHDFYDYNKVTDHIGDFMCPKCVKKDAEWITEVLSKSKESNNA